MSAVLPASISSPIALPPVSAATLDRHSGAAVRGFVGVARAWQLQDEEQLALLGRNNVSRTVLYAWRRGEAPKKPLSVDVFYRISFLLGIYEGLQRLFRRAPTVGDAWLHRANADAPFGGVTPLAFMLQGEMFALAATRGYVDAWTGGPRTGLTEAESGDAQSAETLGIRGLEVPPVQAPPSIAGVSNAPGSLPDSPT